MSRYVEEVYFEYRRVQFDEQGGRETVSFRKLTRDREDWNNFRELSLELRL